MIQDERLTLKISLYDLNRIEVRGDRIQEVFGNSGAFTVDHDSERGQLYIKPTQGNGRRPLSITITTENGLVQDLVLTPFDMPSETIVLKSILNGILKGSSESALGQSLEKELTDLIQSMIQGIVPQGYDLRENERDLLLWDNVQTRRLKRYSGSHFIGEVISFKNDTSKALTLHETQFAPKGTLAVGLQKQRVEPGETVLVYRVLENVFENDERDHQRTYDSIKTLDIKTLGIKTLATETLAINTLEQPLEETVLRDEKISEFPVEISNEISHESSKVSKIGEPLNQNDSTEGPVGNITGNITGAPAEGRDEQRDNKRDNQREDNPLNQETLSETPKGIIEPSTPTIEDEAEVAQEVLVPLETAQNPYSTKDIKNTEGFLLSESGE